MRDLCGRQGVGRVVIFAFLHLFLFSHRLLLCGNTFWTFFWKQGSGIRFRACGIRGRGRGSLDLDLGPGPGLGVSPPPVYII